MYIHFFDRELNPLATVHRIISGNLTVTANERGSAQIVIPSSLPELEAVTLEYGLRAFVYDNAGRLRMNGYLSTVRPGGDDITLEIVDLLEEMRIIPMSPVARLNGYLIPLFTAVLARLPRVDGERWALGDTSKAINSWTTLDASRQSCMEAANSLCEQTGNWFRARGRVIDIYAEPLQAEPIRFLHQGQDIDRIVTAQATLRIVQDIVIETLSEQIYAGIFPEGGSYTDQGDINRTLRLTGKEKIDAAYKMANVSGFWGVFSREKTGDPPLATLPHGLVRSEMFSSIFPIINTTESVDIVVENVAGLTLISSALAGFEQNHWKGAKASFGSNEANVTASFENRITLDKMLAMTVGDNVSVSIERAWDAKKLNESRQSLASAAVAFLKDRSRPQISIQLTVPSGIDDVLMPGDKVHVRYSGGAIMRVGEIERYLQGIRFDGAYAIASVSLEQQESIETDALTVSENLWRWPSASGLKEIMAVIERRWSKTGP